MQKFFTQLIWEVFLLLHLITNHHGANDNVTHKITIICVIILWELRDFIQLTNIMADCSCNQKVSIYDGISLCHKITHLCNSQCVLEKSTDKAMVNCLCCTVCLELFCKGRILSKEGKKQLVQVLFHYAVDETEKFLIHAVHAKICAWHVILHVILALSSLASLCYRNL